MKTIVLFLASFAMAACNSSNPAPKPFTSKSDISAEQIRQKEKEAEAKQPCSDQNLKNATEEQRRKCDPTRGMFENIRPVKPPAKAGKPAQPEKNKSLKETK